MKDAPTYLVKYTNGLKDKGFVPKDHVIQQFNSIGIYEDYKNLIQEILQSTI
ncbi:hypothetical protein ACFPVV_02715 [Macrococcoides bohemicum]|uniref:hypothetical protein n=1 Tax=Macrococcoides bohemicum TaxID=1903056 RepID=UPI001475B532|nr:hypothetical protein [Macrococcus bohemicus]